MSDDLVTVSRSVPIEPGRKPASQSLSVVLASDQPAINVLDAAAIPSDVKASMFGFPITEQRQFLLQELPNYGIDLSTWTNSGTCNYLASRSCVELKPAISGNGTGIGIHQSKFAYKYQPGKQISISQAIQCSIGPVIQDLVIEWGEFTKRDGYGWRVMTRPGTTTGTVTVWHNYLMFFRRTSALPDGKTFPASSQDLYESTNATGEQIGASTLYRPQYLVGTNGLNTDYIESNVWEEIAFTTLDTTRSANFNRDRYTGKNQDGSPAADGVRGNSARRISFIANSYQITGVSINNNNNTFTVDMPTGEFLSPGMTVRHTSLPAGTYISTVQSTVGNSYIVTLSSNATSNINSGTISVNERSNLCMFLIQRSWYGGAGGKGLAYIPDANTPYNGATRWVSGHEIRIGDTLPTPSMSSPDMPITYRIGRKATSGSPTVDASAFLHRFGVSVWIDGGDPRPAKIESDAATGITVKNSAYVPMLAIGVKPWVFNSGAAVGQQQRPQKSRVYPIKLYISSTQNCEVYLLKGAGTLSGFANETDWYSRTTNENLKPVAALKSFSNDITLSNGGYPTLTGFDKAIGAFYCGANEGAEFDLTEIFDPQRELLGRAEAVQANVPGDFILIVARSLVTNTNSIVSCSLIYGVQ